MILGVLSYVCWGFFPLYWKLLHRLPAFEILAHRMIWSCVFYLLLFTVSSWQTGQLKSLFTQPLQTWLKTLLAAGVLAINWGIYIYAVNSGQIVEGSLAYFINPLFNVAVGVLFFKEKLSGILRLALLFALVGVLVQVIFAPKFPWIALTLATSFCTYGVIKKTLRIAPDLSSAMEGLCGLLPALAIASVMRQQSELIVSGHEWAFLIGAGLVTGLPLFLFSHAAQKLPYSMMGMMQFIAPTLQFSVGVWVYGERLGWAGIISFALIWVGAGCYFWNLLRKMAKPSPVL